MVGFGGYTQHRRLEAFEQKLITTSVCQSLLRLLFSHIATFARCTPAKSVLLLSCNICK